MAMDLRRLDSELIAVAEEIVRARAERDAADRRLSELAERHFALLKSGLGVSEDRPATVAAPKARAPVIASRADGVRIDGATKSGPPPVVLPVVKTGQNTGLQNALLAVLANATAALSAEEVAAELNLPTEKVYNALQGAKHRRKLFANPKRGVWVITAAGRADHAKRHQPKPEEPAKPEEAAAAAE